MKMLGLAVALFVFWPLLLFSADFNLSLEPLSCKVAGFVTAKADACADMIDVHSSFQKSTIEHTVSLSLSISRAGLVQYLILYRLWGFFACILLWRHFDEAIYT